MSVPYSAKSSRWERLSAALRQNLKRRKGQSKARSAAEREAGERPKPHDSAEIQSDKGGMTR